jgi:hypothetical protein
MGDYTGRPTTTWHGDHEHVVQAPKVLEDGTADPQDWERYRSEMREVDACMNRLLMEGG